MYGSFESDSALFESSDCFEVLDAHAFHVLGTSGVDFLIVYVGAEWLVGPLVLENGYHVYVAVEEDGWPSRFGSGPC